MDPMLDPLLMQALFGLNNTPPMAGMVPQVPIPSVPPVPVPPAMSMPQAPMVPPQEAYRSDLMVPPGPQMPAMAAPQAPSLGASLEPAAGGDYAGNPWSKGGIADPNAAAGGAAVPGKNGLLDTLKGIKAPEAPQAQKVSTPGLPPLRPIQSGGMFDLLASMGIGPQQAMAGGLKLPSTLGAALGGK